MGIGWIVGPAEIVGLDNERGAAVVIGINDLRARLGRAQRELGVGLRAVRRLKAGARRLRNEHVLVGECAVIGVGSLEHPTQGIAATDSTRGSFQLAASKPAAKVAVVARSGATVVPRNSEINGRLAGHTAIR